MPKGFGQFAAHAKGPLGSGPDRQLAVLPFRHRRAGFERRVRDVGDGVSLLQTRTRGRQTFIHVAHVIAVAVSVDAPCVRDSSSDSRRALCSRAAARTSIPRGGPRARAADNSELGAATPTKSPSCTTMAPGSLRLPASPARAVSRRKRAAAELCRTTSPATSCPKDSGACPVTMSRPFTLGSGLPIDVPLGGGRERIFGRNDFGQAAGPWPARRILRIACVLRIRDLAIRRDQMLRGPSATGRRPGRSAASRAAAATRRSCRFMVGVVRLPNVPMSNGVSSVSPMTSSIVARGRREVPPPRPGSARCGCSAPLRPCPCTPSLCRSRRCAARRRFPAARIRRARRAARRRIPAARQSDFITENTRTPPPRILKKSRRSRSK